MQLTNGYSIGDLDNGLTVAVPQTRFETEQSSEKSSPSFWLQEWNDVSNGGHHPLGGIVVGMRKDVEFAIREGRAK